MHFTRYMSAQAQRLMLWYSQPASCKHCSSLLPHLTYFKSTLPHLYLRACYYTRVRNMIVTPPYSMSVVTVVTYIPTNTGNISTTHFRHGSAIRITHYALVLCHQQFQPRPILNRFSTGRSFMNSHPCP
jgi:hypothetical protein